MRCNERGWTCGSSWTVRDWRASRRGRPRVPAAERRSRRGSLRRRPGPSVCCAPETRGCHGYDRCPDRAAPNEHRSPGCASEPPARNRAGFDEAHGVTRGKGHDRTPRVRSADRQPFRATDESVSREVGCCEPTARTSKMDEISARGVFYERIIHVPMVRARRVCNSQVISMCRGFRITIRRSGRNVTPPT
jgi:hypothetical protein